MEAAELLQGRAAAKGLSLEVTPLTEVPETILTDPTRLRQILINVIGNAVKFTSRGGVRIDARIGHEGPEPKLMIDVADTGVGITNDQLPRLFRPFIQADSSATRRFGGTGLGLAISKRLAEMLGGDLTVVETEIDVGTRFRCTVATGPLPAARAGPVRPAAAADARAAEPVVLHGYRILVAEDCEDNRRLVVRLLERAGATVVEVENGALAVAAVREARNPFDAVLMDIQMPVTDGYEATRLLRAGGYPGAIVALTAHAMTSDRDQCLRAGCDEYITKPIQFALLADAIQRAVANRMSGVGAQASRGASCTR
jgi:CheY-like chemotaxis protein